MLSLKITQLFDRRHSVLCPKCTWTHWTHCLMWLYAKCTHSYQLLCRWGTVRGIQWNSFLWPR